MDLRKLSGFLMLVGAVISVAAVLWFALDAAQFGPPVAQLECMFSPGRGFFSNCTHITFSPIALYIGIGTFVLGFGVLVTQKDKPEEA